MKIHKLIIKNIASLRGKHSINFDEIYETSSLFAITGKTGSGKSTILNCLSLALYGKNYKSNTHSYDFITLGEKEGSITLHFSTGDKTYKAHWKLKLRKSNGEELKKPKLARELLEKINENDYLALDTTAESVLSMDFNQFCRTTILNQGEFAKFLTSSFPERKDILEKFYEGAKLTGIGNALKLKIKVLEQKIEKKLSQIKGLDQSAEDITITKKELLSQMSELSKINDAHTFSKASTSLLKDLTNISDSKYTNESRLLQLIKKGDELQKEYNHILKETKEIKEKKLLFENNFKLRAPRLKEAREKEVTKQEILKYLESKSTALRGKETQLKALQESIEIKTQAQDEIVKMGKQIKSLNPSLDTHKLEDIEKDLLHLQKNNQELTFTIESYSKALEKQKGLSTSIQELEEQIKTLAPNKVQADTKTLKEQIVLIESQLLESRNALSEKNNLQKNLAQIQENILSKEKIITNFEIQNEQIQKRHESIQNEYNLSKNAIKYFELQKAIMICHEETSKTNICLVCGQAANLDQKLDSLDQKEYAHAQSELEMGQSKLETSALEVQDLNFKIKSIHSEIKDLTDKKINLIETIGELENVKTNSIQSTENDLDRIRAQYLKEELNTQKIKSATEVLNEKRVEINLINKEMSSLSSKQEAINSQIQYVSALYHLQGANSLKYEKLSSFLKNKEKVNKLSSDYKSTKALIENNKDQLCTLINEIKKLKEQIVDDQDNVSKIDVFIKSHTSAGAPLQELKELEAQKESILTDQELCAKKMKNSEIQISEIKSRQNSYEDQIKDASLLIENIIQKLRDLKPPQQTKELAQLHRLEEIALKVTTLPSVNIEQTLEILQASLKQALLIESEFHKEQQEAQITYAGNKAIFDRKEKAQAQIKEISLELEDEQAKYKSSMELNQLIGKDEFRSYILAIIEKMLIEQTNLELEKLCSGRYKLNQFQKDSSRSSEFKIIDYYHDGMERKVSTLSGGETFLVSLAMALALAELMRGTAQIDSLFIDEGFGTLDSDAIEDAFELLQTIQFSGKQVGIISHVKSLTDRIPVNINLTRHEDRSSKISLVYN